MFHQKPAGCCWTTNNKDHDQKSKIVNSKNYKTRRFWGDPIFQWKNPWTVSRRPSEFQWNNLSIDGFNGPFFRCIVLPPKTWGPKKSSLRTGRITTKTSQKPPQVGEKCAESNIWFWCKHLILMCFEPKVWCHTPRNAVYFLRFSQTFGRDPTELASDFMEHVSPRSHPLFGAYFCKSISESC